MKKILALIMAILMLTLCLASCSKDKDKEDDESEDALKGEEELVYEYKKNTFTYTTNADGSYEITGIEINSIKHIDVVIPADIKDDEGNVIREFTGIAAEAFKSISTIDSVEIPEGILYIGDYAFWGCTSLEDVELPKSLTTIGEGAFEKCTALEEVEISEGSALATIDSYAFNDCVMLEELDLGEALTTVGDGAFLNCESFTGITLPASVTKIGSAVFNGCKNLKEIVVLADEIEMGEAALFTGTENVECSCPNLETVYYKGSESNWNLVTAEDSCFANATCHFYSEAKPTDAPNKYWRYENGVPKTWEEIIKDSLK